MDRVKAKMFEEVFIQSINPIVVLKADKPIYTIVAINNQYKATTRTLTDNIIGKGAFEVYKPYDKASEQQFAVLKSALNQSVENKEQINLPAVYFEGRSADGIVEKTWWQFKICPILDDNGNVEYLMCITLDVSKEQLAKLELEQARDKEQMLNEELITVNEELTATNEELIISMEELARSQDELYQLNNELEDRISARTAALAESEKRYQSILNALPQIAWTNSSTGEVDFYNQKWYDYTGLDYESPEPGEWQEVIHPDDLQYNLDQYASILKSNKPGEFEIREKGADGKYRWHLVRIAPFHKKNGITESWIGTATDIEELKQIQQLKDDFIGNVSHELKTPLTSIKAYVQFLNIQSKEENIPVAYNVLNKVEIQINKMANMINGFLNLSMLDAGKIHLNLQEFNLTRLIDELIDEITGVSSSHVINFIPGNPIHLIADRAMIAHVVSNLLSNAIKYSSIGTTIEVLCEVIGNNAQVVIKDAGIGIRSKDMKRLFQRYYRIEGNLEKQPGGFGIGLYLCAQIVRLHNGSIWAKSTFGKGSAFYFSLPLNLVQS